MSPAPTAPYDPVTDYATRVVSGEILANRWVKLACQRHLSDLNRTDIFWDLKAALHHINFFPKILRLSFKEEPHIRPFHLCDFQAFIQGSLFGWKKRDKDGTFKYRRFQYSYIEIAKGAGKSPLGGGTALYMGSADGEPNAQCYFAAGKKDQAMIAFQAAVDMREISPEINKRFAKSGVKPCWQLTYAYPQSDKERRLLGSFLKPIASDSTQSGPRPHFVLFDEVHEIDRPTVVDMMRKAMGKNRTQPMAYEITNSGVDRTSICYQHRLQAERMLDGTVPNDSLFAYICGLDIGNGNEEECICAKSSSWDRRVTCPCCGDLPPEIDGVPQDQMEYLLAHEEIWVKANPGIGQVPDYEYVRQQIKDAIGLPSQRNLVLRLHFCIWTDAITVWIPDDTWMACADESLSERVSHPIHGEMTRLESLLIGRRCYGGLDLARSNDWSSLVLVFPDIDDVIGLERADMLDPNNQTYAFLEYYWIDEATYNERYKKNKMMEVWREAGDLFVTPGAVFNPGVIQSHILSSVVPRYPIAAISYDRTFAHQIVLNLREENLTMVEWAPTFWWMGAPVEEIARRAKARLWWHRGHPVTRWMMRNVAIETDAGGLQRINKERSTEKVDGPVALAYGLGWCMRANKGDGKSVYEERGPIIIDDVYY